MLVSFLFKKIFGNAVWNFPAANGVLYLTFDDGPNKEITPWVLDVLKQHNAQATFFCVGENVEKNFGIYKRILSEGHAVGNHTMNHLKGWTTKNKNYFENIAACRTIVDSKLFRPPYGKIKPSQMRILKKDYKIIMWDVMSRDFDASIDGEKCFQNVKDDTKKGSIIVFHDSEKASPRLRQALPKTLEYFSDNGFRFHSISC